MLIGLVAKNGILIVEFANQKQEGGENKMQAIRDAALQRLRPILMTSASTVLGLIAGIRNRRRRQPTYRHGYGCCGRNVSIYFPDHVYRTGYL